MSLLDSIKYPVSDVYDWDEVSQLPPEIIHQWLNRCREDAGLKSAPMPSDVKHRSSLWSIIYAKVHKLSRGISSGSNVIEELIKIKYLKILRETIVEYDTD